jgi:hypothetical protein
MGAGVEGLVCGIHLLPLTLSHPTSTALHQGGATERGREGGRRAVENQKKNNERCSMK